MGRKKDETQKLSATLRKALQKGKVETGKPEFQEKLDRLVQSLRERISDPIHSEINYKQRINKLSFLTKIYLELRSIYRPYKISEREESLKGNYKLLLEKYLPQYLPNSDSISISKKEAKNRFVELPDDIIISIFFDFLSSEWEPTKDSALILILLEVLIFYYEYIEVHCPPSITYQIDIATMRLIWATFDAIIQMDKKGRHSDRTSMAGLRRKEISEKESENVRQAYIGWLNENKEIRYKIRKHLTKYGIAKIIKDGYKLKFSTKKIVEIMERYHLEKKTSTPWE